ncbi:WxL domain-containing protein [Enterococcus faecalis]|uniref:WxL domain-containing protein n=1 Tax=Enterococcus faecalis TaxID=1351 RepID=UPI003CCC4ADD
MSITPLATYTGDKTKYPIAKEIRKDIEAPYTLVSQVDGEVAYNLSSNGNVFGIRSVFWSWDTNKTPYAMGIYSGRVGKTYNLASPDGTIYYYLENRRVTENFVDATGAKIMPPTGFTQGNKIVIDSDNFTYTSAKALPDTYKAGGKTYKFKGWYKGTDKTALKTTKTPSYAVTYDDKDDMTAVYEDLGETTTLPAQTFKFSFVDEQGNLVNPSGISLKGNLQEYVSDETPKLIGEIIGKDNGMVKEYTIPEKVFYGVTDTRFSFYGAKTSVFTIPKYYKSLAKNPGTYYSKTAKVYPAASIRRKNFITDVLDPEVPNDLTYQDLFSRADPTQFLLAESRYNASPTNTRFTALGMAFRAPSVGFVVISKDDSPIYYYLENRRVTENFVDATGAKITPPTGFTQGNKIVIDSDNFTYTSAKALPDTYTAGGKTYKFKGWYKGTDKTALKTTKTPSYAVTYDDKDDMTAVYEEVAMVTLPGYTYQFGFVGESGQLIDPAKIGLTYDMWAYEDKKETFTEKSVKASDNGNLKEMKIEDRSVVKPTAETAGQDTIYSPVNLQFTLPKYYQKVTPSDGKNLNYPVPQMIQNSTGREENLPVTEATFALKELQPYTYGMENLYTNSLTPNTPYPIPFRRYTKWAGGTVPVNIMYSKISPIYYMLENRRVTENFVDATGAKITPPTGFTQGKQTVIDSENFTYTSAKALPATYTVGDKNYRFKGWYKGTDKTDLKTTKTPSYAVTYDNKDDMTAVYEEVQETTVHPGFYAEFVDEQGKAFTNPLTLSGNYTEFLRKNATSPFEATGSLYPMAGSKEATVANRYKVETKQNVLIPNNYELLPDPATGVLNRGFALNNFGITNELKYVDKVEATTKTITLYDYDTISDIGTNLLSDAATTSLNSFETTLNKETNNTFSVKAKWGQSGLSRDILPNLLFLTSANSKPRLFGFDGTSDYKQTINYKITRKQVTENFVDATGAKITPPTGFTQGKQTPMTSNSFTYTSANALPDKYTAGGKAYQFKGWYKGTDQTALKTTKTPSYAVTYDDKDDMTAVYEEVQPTAEMTVSRLLEVIPNEASMVWTVRLKNTSEVPLTNVKLAPTAKWAAGISAPTQLAVRIGSTPNKIIPVTAEQWQAGVNLDIEIPVNGEALVTVGTAKITGEPRQLLTAEMTASGNFSAVTASNFVHIQGEDQTITPAPVEEGFISTPTFDFGKITISSSAKQYGLKKAADYYGNGTRNPYLRIKTDQPNWQLTAQLSQLKAATDSLPTSTRLLLGNADVAAIENYNQVTESTNKVGVTKALTLTSDGTSTPVVLNNQFTGNDVYQLDFDFASVKLDVPANQGKINEKYQGTVTWNLVTGP